MSLSDSEDDLIAYGTPVEPLEEDEIPSKKPRLLEDQVVTDKQGRRRFHGAFTGGFSAGFFNTVGSLEGWTPSSFKSSRSKKQEIFRQKPEDFMDEEDVSEFGIAPVVLKARQGYTNESKTEGPAFSELLTLGNYVLQDVLKPVRETIGIKLLKKMGWKPGQGVGPRLNKSEKNLQLKMRQKTYGCQLPPGALEDKESNSNSDSEEDDIEFAPSDYEPLLLEARNNFCGLGYEGLDKRPVLSGNSYLKEDAAKKKNRKFGFSSQAFGVGAFEEEDEDIYARDDMSRYNFFLGKDESSDPNKLDDKGSVAVDGVLEGFALEAKTRRRKNYPLPIIPKDIKPQHKIRRSRFDRVSPENNKKIVKGNHEDRRKQLEQPREEALDAKKQKEILVQKLICNVRTTENKFKPFSINPEKQERYENYLKLVKIGKKELLTDLQPLSMTNWDKEREKVEFEKAAQLFKPLTGGMEDRFAVASQPDDITDPLAVVEKYFDENDDRRKAAKMKMFGPITRRTETWVPDSVLCKRFNIPQPDTSNSRSSEKQKGKSYFNLFDSIPNFTEKVDNVDNNTNMVEKIENSPEEKTKEEEPETPVTTEENITDLYKAIFLDSDDEEKSSEDVNKEEKVSEHQNSNRISGNNEPFDDISYEEKLINSKRNLSPPKGIFENINFDLLSGKEKREDSAPEESRARKTVEVEDTTESLVYGPQIPEKITVKTGFFTGELLQDGGVWVEKNRHSGKKHKKKDKKSKKSSHKSKHKHKHKR